MTSDEGYEYISLELGRCSVDKVLAVQALRTWAWIPSTHIKAGYDGVNLKSAAACRGHRWIPGVHHSAFLANQ